GAAFMVDALHVRDDAGDVAVLELRIGNILQPFGEEPRDVHVEAGSADKDLCIAGPSESLVALWTVGGDVEEVAFLAPENVVLKLVDHRIGTFEFAGGFAIGMDDDAGEIIDGGISTGIIAHLDVAKPVKRESRLEEFFGPATRCVVISGAGGAQRGRVW